MRAGIYIRKSREEKEKVAFRLAYQRDYLPKFAREKGWSYEIYDDGNASAARGKTDLLLERARLETDIRQGQIDVILVIELSRLSRDESLEDYVAWLYLCSQHQVRLATTSRTLDPAHMTDWIILIMEGGYSSAEMRTIRTRMAEGRKKAYFDGKFLGGNLPPPYCYDRAQRKVVIDPDSLERMERLWTLAETTSAMAIAKQLGMPEIAVRRAIADDRLLYYQGLRPNTDGGEYISGEWEAVMDAARAARIRAARRTRKNYNGEKREAAALCSNLGVLYCGYCGRTIKSWNNSKRRRDGSRLDYYGCQVKSNRGACKNSRLIPQSVLNERILTNIFNTLGNLEELKAYWLAEQDRQDPTEELKKLADKERQQKRKKENLIEAIAEGIIKRDDAKRQMADIEAAVNEIEQQRAGLLIRAADPPDWESLEFFREDFDVLDFADQRAFVRAAIERIDVYSSYAIITYPFPRNADGECSARIHLPPPLRGTAVGRKPRHKA